MKITTKTESFTSPLYLESGRILEPYDLIYETYGKMNQSRDNIIVITHALTGSHHCAGRYEDEAKAGWWDNLIGDGKVIDTKKYFVICVNVIGSNFGSTSPKSNMFPTKDRQEAYRYKFPVVTIKDMVKAQKILFNKLGIFKVKAVIGGSMGGMQALEFAVSYPNFAEIIIPIATTPMTRAWTVAFNKVAMEAIVNDPSFKNGYYDFKDFEENSLKGLAVARMSGYISYLSPSSMESKFGREYVGTDGIYELFGRFEIERYLEYNGYNFPKWFDPLCYLYLIKAINIFDLSRGFDSLKDAIAQIESKLYLIALKEDYLFNPKEMREVYDISRDLPNRNLINFYEVDTDYGHDAFLVEVDKFSDYIADILSN